MQIIFDEIPVAIGCVESAADQLAAYARAKPRSEPANKLLYQPMILFMWLAWRTPTGQQTDYQHTACDCTAHVARPGYTITKTGCNSRDQFRLDTTTFGHSPQHAFRITQVLFEEGGGVLGNLIRAGAKLDTIHGLWCPGFLRKFDGPVNAASVNVENSTTLSSGIYNFLV